MPHATTREVGTNGEVAGRNGVRSSTERRRVVDDPRGRRAGNSGSDVGSGSTKDKAKEQSREVAQRTRQQASQVAKQGREQAKSQIATQKERAARQLEGVAQVLQQSGQQFREQDQDSVGQYADRAAEQVEWFSSFLRERDADQLIGEAENLARRQPAVFLGGALALGVLGARFLKASSSNQTGTSGQGGSTAPDSRASGQASATSRGAVTYDEAGEGLEPSYGGEGERELDRESDLRRRTRNHEE